MEESTVIRVQKTLKFKEGGILSVQIGKEDIPPQIKHEDLLMMLNTLVNRTIEEFKVL